MTSRETDAAWNRTNSEGNIMTDTTQAPHLKAAAQQALTVLRGCLEHPDASDAISALQHAIAQPDATTQPVEWRYDFNGDWWHTDDEKKAKSIKADGRKIQPLFTTPQPAPAPEWVMLDEGEVNAIIMQARIDWGNATARFPSEVEIAALAIQKAFIGKQENKPDSAPLSMSMFASKADFDAATQPAKPEPQITGCTEQGFMIDSASANELVACDYAASTLCSAVLRILDGERNGFESQNEPWATVRNRLLARLDAAESTTQRVIEPFNPEPMAGSGQAAWMDIAREYATSACFYRGIVVEIGEKFGEAAQICDDGTTSDGILLLKIPELVDAMKARLDAAELDSKLLDWLDRELACPLTLHDGRYLNLGDKGVRQVISEAMKGKL